MSSYGETFFEGKKYTIAEQPVMKNRSGYPYGLSYSAKVTGPDGETRQAYWKLLIEYLQESHCSADEWRDACSWEQADDLE